MSAPRAIAFLWTRSVRNWIRAQVKRLKNPRYLIAAVVGLAYFYWLFVQRLVNVSAGPREAPGLDGTTVLEAGLTLGMALAALSTWIFGGSRGLLQFTEAEVQYLFPAPLTRRAILQVRVLKTLLRTALSAAITSFFIRRAWGANGVALALGTWMAFASLSLHGTGVSLLRESLWSHGRAGWRRRIITLGLLALALGAVAYWTVGGNKPPPPDQLSAESLAAWLRQIFDSAPLSWVLWPLRAPVRLAMAEGWADLLWRLPAALAVLGALYAWVISSSVAFEEAAVEAAGERARKLEGARRTRAGLRLVSKVKSSRLPLPRRGPAWIALTWKNLIAARRLTGPGLVIVLLVMALPVGWLAVRSGRADGEQVVVPVVIGIGAAVVSVFLAFFGPISVSADLRQDLPMSDVLRTLPLSGQHVVLGEVLASTLLLAVGQWALWIAAAILTWDVPVPGLEGPQRGALVLGAMAFGPALSMAGLCVQNAGAILFPAWATNEARFEGRGFEAAGQRVLTLVGTLVVLAVALVPAGLVGGLVALAGFGLLGPWALAIGAVAGAAVLVAECLLTIRLLGTLFERLDLTE